MVEIIFSNKKEKKDIVKVGLIFGKINKNYLADFFDRDELDLLISLAKRENFKAEKNEILATKTKNADLVLIATAATPSAYDLEVLGAKLYSAFKDKQKICIYAQSVANAKIKTAEIAYNIGLGFEMSSYSFDKYFTTKKMCPKLETVVFAAKNKVISKNGYKDYAALATGVRYARDLTNEPSNHLTPAIMADDIKRLEYLGLEIEVLDKKSMQEREFNLALSVAQGSANEPRIVVLKYKGNPDKQDFDLGLVGKGVTFDSGGISLKPANGMWDMKQDMAGSAAVVGAIKALALQKLNINVVAVVGLVENMPSGTATRPGDVVRSMSGQTVEILNTDAEGRLILADCLWYIQQEYNVKKLVNIATLTGAILVALGKEMAGIMGNNQEFINNIVKAANQSNEKVWQLPLTKEYNQMINSSIADMKNISEGRYAGSITAGCFLQRFIKKDVKWVHIDMAGMDNVDKPKPLYPKGASGFGVKLFNQLMKNIHNQ
ncbi:MAG: leucyl aminopeptidase [Alphaproteobacteria bacterium]|nr:leucyl aminopeptidase [Alphaproteobacteria bacterium]